MQLKLLTDKQLHLDLKKLATQEKKLTSHILYHLKEVDRRKLFCDYKYSGLQEYCEKELGYSSDESWRRVNASRIFQEIPNVERKLDEGQLTLTTLSMINSYCNKQGIKDTKEKLKLVSSIEGKSRKETEVFLLEKSGKKNERPENARLVAPGRTELRITVSDETLKKIKKIKDFYSNGRSLTLEETIDLLLDTAIEKLEVKNTSAPARVNKTLTPKTKKYILNQGQNQCEQCGSTQSLQIDHRYPLSVGGNNDPENLRVLCRNCNLRAAILFYGVDKMTAEATRGI